MKWRLIALAATLALVVTACGTSGAPEASGTPEGVTVHGHWTIDLIDKDGSLKIRHEFDNALDSRGGDFLAELLAGNTTIGQWKIIADESSGNSPCGDASAQPCWIVESGAAGVSDNLTVSSASGVVTLAGDFVATRDGVINRVATWLSQCSPTFAPSSCGNPTTNVAFTGTFPSPINVNSGQQVQITVDISFS